MDSDDFSLEGGHERLPLKDARENEEASSVPLLIVGNKVDKLSASGKLTLQAACAQQVFVVRHSVTKSRNCLIINSLYYKKQHC